MKRFLLFALLSILCIPRISAQPVTLETKWTEKTFAIAFTGVSSGTLDIGGFGSWGRAVLGKTYTLNGVDGTTFGASATVSTNTTNVIAFDYTVLAAGGTVSLQYAQTVKTPPPGAVNALTLATVIAYNSPAPTANAFTVPLISTSSLMSFPSSTPYSEKFSAEVSNPVFYFTNLSAGATLYFTSNYGVPRVQ